MNDIDDLLRSFRADVPGPAEGAAERISARVRHAHVQAVDTRAHAGRRWRRGLRWVLVPAAAAAAVASVAIALSPVGDATEGDRPAVPGVLAQAEAAIAMPNEILALSIQIRRTTTDPNVVNRHQTITMRQWTLPGADRAMRSRALITEGPSDKPPTDEDSTYLTDRTGKVIDQRSWTPVFVHARDHSDYPDGGGAGELQVGGPPRQLEGPSTLAATLRDAYQRRLLHPAGRTPDGGLRLTGDMVVGGAGACVRTSVLLDPQTFIPRTIDIVSRAACDSDAPIAAREIWTVTAQQLPATTTNRRLLSVGDWPTTRVVQWISDARPAQPIDHVPPVPPLDER